MALFTNLAILATFAGALVFVASYAWLTRGAWRRTPVGVNVMTLMAVITIVSSLAVIGIFAGRDWPGRDLIRGLAWSAVAACIWWRVALLRRAQKSAPRNPAPEPPSKFCG